MWKRSSNSTRVDVSIHNFPNVRAVGVARDGATRRIDQRRARRRDVLSISVDVNKRHVHFLTNLPYSWKLNENN